jgi:20S proteasome alpha/beta subunit
MTLEQAQVLALSTLKQVMEEKIDSKNVEMAVISVTFVLLCFDLKAADGLFKIYSAEEVEAVIQRI